MDFPLKPQLFDTTIIKENVPANEEYESDGGVDASHKEEKWPS